MDAFDQLQAPQTQSKFGRWFYRIRGYFSPAGMLIGFSLAGIFSSFAMISPILLLSALINIVWCGHVCALAEMDREAKMHQIPNVSKRVDRIFRRNALMAVLIAIAEGYFSHWPVVVILTHALMLVSFGAIACMAPPLMTLGAFVLCGAVAYANISVAADADALGANWTPLLLASVMFSIIAHSLWKKRRHMLFETRPRWTTPAFMLNRTVWSGGAQRPWWNNPNDLSARALRPDFGLHGATAPTMAIRSILGIPFLVSRRITGILWLAASIFYGVIVAFDVDPSWVKPDAKMAESNHVIVMLSMFVFGVALVLNRIHALAKNASEMAELHLLPGLGQARCAHEQLLRSTLGISITKFAALAISMLCVGASVMASTGHTNWIVPDLLVCVCVLAIALCTSIAVALKIMQQRLHSRFYVLCIVGLSWISATTLAHHPSHVMLFVVAIIANSILAFYFYRRWLRQPHPYLMP